ncbi:MAG: hypothetical protein O2816_04250 [Planctomycetota bacterium]|nr:hypothetical protein [Planctomycetota bacterium]
MADTAPAHYAWFDTEFTDLDLDQAHLIQVALVVTDVQLRPIVPAAVPVEIPAGCVRTNGLNVYLPLPEAWEPQPFHLEHMADVLQACRASAYTLAQSDAWLAAWMDACVGAPAASIGDRPVLAGNSVHNDWWLARRDLPAFMERLHYRLVDASGFKSEWLSHYGGEGATLLDKEDQSALREAFPAADLSAAAHDAYFDAQASCAELAWYRARLKA